MNKKSLLMVGAVVLVLVVVLAWNLLGGQARVSEGAESVIRAAATGPNTDLFDMAAMLQISSANEEERAAAQEASEKQMENWQTAVGAYFAEGALEQFINNGYATGYLAQAAVGDQTLALKELTLVEKADNHESVDFTYAIGEQEFQARAEFSLDSDGLISRAEFIPTEQLS